ncbi:MAG: 50S ribosomal protein L18 [Candidatus Tectomicrobia bacterium]|nr:50S ribosomal protein L18 [Candidatus Tectomicrobia bacterium]
MFKKISRREARAVRRKRVRTKISGTSERPRLSVFKSCQYIYAELIDDTKGETLASATSLGKGFQERAGDIKTKNREAAKIVGEILAERALAKGISQVVFDRSGYLYHGKIAALADAVREKGIIF